MQQRLLERQGLVLLWYNCASAQLVPVPLPLVVLVGFVWVGGNIGRLRTALAPRLPLFLALQLEGACVQQRLLERQEVKFAWKRECWSVLRRGGSLALSGSLFDINV